MITDQVSTGKAKQRAGLVYINVGFLIQIIRWPRGGNTGLRACRPSPCLCPATARRGVLQKDITPGLRCIRSAWAAGAPLKGNLQTCPVGLLMFTVCNT